MVGADGAHSAVRSSVDIPMDGSDDLGAYYTVTFRAPLSERLTGSRHALYMVPDAFAFHDILPKTSTDKIDYQTLKGLG